MKYMKQIEFREVLSSYKVLDDRMDIDAEDISKIQLRSSAQTMESSFCINSVRSIDKARSWVATAGDSIFSCLLG